MGEDDGLGPILGLPNLFLPCLGSSLAYFEMALFLWRALGAEATRAFFRILITGFCQTKI